MDGTWVLFRAAAYLTGRGLTYGTPLVPANALNPDVYSLVIGGVRASGVAGVDEHLSVIADGSLDHVLLMPQIAAHNSPEGVIREAAKKLKVGGHLILYTLIGISEMGVATLYPSDLHATLAGCGHWRIKAEYTQDREYLLIVKRVEGRRGVDPIRVRASKRACIARYGALGDAVMMTPLIRALADDGYEVTLNISEYCLPVVENNPYVSNIVIQVRDMIPNHLLGKYWQMWEHDYDKYVNLSESCEGDLLQIEGRAAFFTSRAWRHKNCDKNYYDYTMARGGYPARTGEIGELFFTSAEERNARGFFKSIESNFVAIWALNGSSHHKIYPLMQPLLREWFKLHLDARVITTGDYTGKLMEFDHPQLMGRCGVWGIRESLIATKYANLVIGPETMMTNAAGCFDTPKIVFLSHSSRENLTKYFKNDFSLEPDQVSCPCYPCHQLHHSKESCPTGEMRDISDGAVLGQAPLCSISISPERVMAQLDQVYNLWKETCGVRKT